MSHDQDKVSNFTDMIFKSFEELWLHNAINSLALDYIISLLEKEGKLDKKELTDYVNAGVDNIKNKMALELFKSDSVN
jgi:hypothetical protein